MKTSNPELFTVVKKLTQLVWNRKTQVRKWRLLIQSCSQVWKHSPQSCETVRPKYKSADFQSGEFNSSGNIHIPDVKSSDPEQNCRLPIQINSHLEKKNSRSGCETVRLNQENADFQSRAFHTCQMIHTHGLIDSGYSFFFFWVRFLVIANPLNWPR